MAVLASVAALQIAGIAQNSANPLSRLTSIGAATFVLGAGIWSMHFIGMLAFRLCTPVSYRAGPTLLSMLPGLTAAFVAVLLLTRRKPTPLSRSISGALIGAGIAAMHYSGMAAMEIGPALRYDPVWFTISLVAGISLSVLALQVHGGLARLRWLSLGGASAAGGVVLGLAIGCTHYIGMQAALFVGQEDRAYADAGPPVPLALAVALVALLVIGVFGSIWGLLHYRALTQLLRSNEQRLQSVIEGTVEGIVVLDEKGRIVRFNQSAERVTGHAAAAVLGRPLARLLMHPDAALDAYLAGMPLPDGGAAGTGIVREVTVRGPAGKPLDTRLSIGRVQVPGEQLFVAFLSDIGEQKRTQRALREREAQYGALIRNIPGTFFRTSLDPSHPAMFVSERIQSIVGWSAAEFMSGERSLNSLAHPDDLPRVMATVNAAADPLGSRDFSFECRVLHADGSHRWVSVNGEVELPAEGGSPDIDGVMIDITEAKLRAAEFEGTVRAIGHALAVVEFDVAGRVTHANDNFLALTGYALDEIRGQRHAKFCDADDVDSPAYRDFWNTLLLGEFHVGEYKRFGRDGRTIWVHASYNPVLGADGRLLKIVKFASDITDRRAVQEALREAKERAEQAAAARSAFLANMSHEIRTPMNAVIGFTELLMDTPLSATQKKHLETVHQSAASLLGLLNGILDTAKLEKGAVELELRDFSLRELLTHATDSLRIAAHAKQVSLELDYADTLGDHFRGDALRMRQVLLNLVSNAVKFTERGSVRVLVRLQHDAGAGPAGAVPLHIAVHDTGIGIAADRLESIFQPFQQADASMSRRFGGTGLGVTIARQLVELMGGTLVVQSRLGEGSVFHVRLWLQPAAPPRALPAPAEADADEKPMSVLVVDDIRQNAELLDIALGAAGHTVTIATDGASAIETWSTQEFDMVLMDIHMPGMDGLTATRHIRALEAATGRPRSAIVALTASVLEEDKRGARDAGMDGFVAKPVNLDQLRREMARAVEAVTASRATRTPPEPTQASPADEAAEPVTASAEAAFSALLHGEIDVEALDHVDRALRARGDGALADLLADTISQFDFERAATLLAPLSTPPEKIAA